MIKLLRTNTPINYAVMLIVMLVLWVFKFYYMPTPIETFDFQSLLLPTCPETVFCNYASAGAAFIVLYAFAVLLIKVNSDLQIIESAYQSPGFAFVLLTGVFINTQRVIPVLIASLLLFLAIIRVFYAFNRTNAKKNSFDAGFLTALSFIIFNKFIFLSPLVFIVFLMIRQIKLKEIIIFIVGLVMPIFIVAALVYLYGDSTAYYESIVANIEVTFTVAKYNTYNYSLFLPIVIMSILAVVSKFIINKKLKVSSRRHQNALVLIIIVFLVFFVSIYSSVEGVVLLFAPLSLFLSNIIMYAKRINKLVVLYGFIIVIIMSQLMQIAYYLSLY